MKILSALVMSLLSGAVISMTTGISPGITVTALMALSFMIPHPSDILATSLFDLARPDGNNVGAGGGVDTEIILINAIDVDLSTFPARLEDGVTISTNIPMKAGKYMHRFYMTTGTIEPIEKKLKGENKDCGGFEVGVKGFFPGLAQAVQKWKANFGFGFEGFVIIQNCATSTKYLLGEPCNLVSVDDMEAIWGASVDKGKGTNFIFKGTQSAPMAIYSGELFYDPGSASW